MSTQERPRHRNRPTKLQTSFEARQTGRSKQANDVVKAADDAIQQALGHGEHDQFHEDNRQGNGE